MTHSPASASGDQPPADPGLTAVDLTAVDLTAQNLTAQNLTAQNLTAQNLTAQNLTAVDPTAQNLTAGGLAARLAADGELTAEDIAALARLDDGSGAAGGSWDDDPGPHRDGEPGADWLTLPDDAIAALLDGEPPSTTAPEVLDAGFTHYLPTAGATGFAAGGPLDAMLPGSDLAWHVGAARRRGLSELSDDELCGMQQAARRLGSWATGLELAAVAELDARRADPDGRPGEYVSAEVAAVLTLTARASDSLLALTRNLAPLPQTRALLAAGIIDQPRAAVIADALAVLDPAGAAAVENQITPRAAAMTTGQLRAACQRAILAHDPQAAQRRRERAEKDARVECWAEADGTSAIAGRDLAPAGVIAADKTLDADARWLRQHGMPGSHDQRRAAAFLARLTNRPLTTLLPAADAAREAGSAAATSGNPTTGTAAATGTGTGTGTPESSTSPAAPPSTNPANTPGTSPAASPGPNRAAAAGWVGGLGGTVNLTMPASAWLGLSDAPGEAGGPGALDADTCRDLAAALAANPATRWCVTIVDRHGRPTAHGCARDGPGPPAARNAPGPSGVRDGPGPPGTWDQSGPPGGTDLAAAWLATVKISPIETGTCSHRRESAGYQPSNTLRHIIKIRSPRCGFPGCRRPAIRCDDDHTIPYDKGGRTCECNLHPLCRRHHQAKQAPGWRLEQPEPGVLIWHLPHGRSYAVRPEPYPV
jgi:hypothetical protein